MISEAIRVCDKVMTCPICHKILFIFSTAQHTDFLVCPELHFSVESAMVCTQSEINEMYECNLEVKYAIDLVKAEINHEKTACISVCNEINNGSIILPLPTKNNEFKPTDGMNKRKPNKNGEYVW